MHDTASGQDWLYGLQRFGMKLGLDNSRALCRLLDHPERSFSSVLIAGTNGKGSVAAMLDAILAEAGFLTGLYTSPHLVRPQERIRIAGRDISDVAWQSCLRRVRETIEAHSGSSSLPRHPTFFEVLTAMAFEAFRARGVDIAVLEVGLGGRFDATNIADPALSVVCTVDLDHQEQLGADLASIAREKAGVFRSGRPALVGEQKPEPWNVLRRMGMESGAQVETICETVHTETLDDGLAGPPPKGGILRLDAHTPVSTYRRLEVSLPGQHQAGNVALALRAAERLSQQSSPPSPFALGQTVVRRGLSNARWPGRLEWVAGDPPLLLDCAHNTAGAATLAHALRRVGPGRCVLLFGAMADKDYAGMARLLAPSIRAVVATRPDVERAAPAEDVLAPFSAFTGVVAVVEPHVAAALDRARALAGSSGIVCVGGSIYLVGEVRKILETDGHSLPALL